MGTNNLAASIVKNEMWKLEIKYLEDENIRFKINLANILANDGYKYQIERMEHFQNRFLKMDEQLNLLKHDVREQLQLLQTYNHSNAQQLKTLEYDQLRLEMKMILLRRDFDNMAGDFNDFVKAAPS